MYEFAHCRLMSSFLCHCNISFNDDVMQIFHKNNNTFHFVNTTLLVNKSVFDLMFHQELSDSCKECTTNTYNKMH